MTLAFKADVPSTEKLVLLALCDSANDQGECYPSVMALVKKCSLTDRAIQKAIQSLEEGGYLTREMRQGRSTVYWMTPEPRSPHPRTTFTPEPGSPPNVVHPTPERRSPPPPNHVHPTPERGSPRTINEPSEEPSGNRHKARAPGDVDAQVWSDWVQVRKAKKAPVTETALEAIRSEALKAGMTLEAALRIACQRGWAGFKAEWVQEARAGPGKADALMAGNIAAAQRFLKGREQ